MRPADFAHQRPPELIALEPAAERADARMKVRAGGRLAHARVRELGAHLRAGDLLVVNTSRVFPARLEARKASGGAVEILLVHPEAGVDAAGGGARWRALVRGRVRAGMRLCFDGAEAVVERLHEDGTRTVAFAHGVDAVALAERIGHVPLPPYIQRADTPRDRERYQTVYARRAGSVAAPTAGLHLDQGLIDGLKSQGVEFAEVELAIGPGTFTPVRTERVEDFEIHAEACACPAQTGAAIKDCRARGGRVVAVGTTVMRTLETAARQDGGFAPFAGWTRLFLHPPQRFQVVDAMLTNFHLPRSTLLMAVACLIGADELRELYRAAIAERYRFLSYGDCMLLLP